MEVKIESKQARNGVDSELFETQKWSSWSQQPFISAPTIVLANSEVAKATEQQQETWPIQEVS